MALDWYSLLVDLDPCDAWSVFHSKVVEVVNKCVPLKKVCRRKRPVWMSREVLKAVRKKRKLWRCFKQSKSSADLDRYKRHEVYTKGLIRDTKVLFEKRLAKEVKINPKSFHSYVRSKQKVKEVVGPLQGIDGELIDGGKDMAEVLNDYFVSVFTEESTVLVPDSLCTKSSVLIRDVDFSVDVVSKKLKGLNSNKAPGPDSIHPIVLRECSDALSVPLSIIFSKCFDVGVVPSDWRIANVTPIFKKGNHSSPCNYRPVSLTSVVCKVMESIVKDAVLDHLLGNGLLNLSQHGFLPKRSCVSNLLEFLDDVTKQVDSSHNVDVIYLDFQKAFDKVPLGRLMQKTKALGVQGKCAEWINSWLSDRLQRVVVNGEVSSWRKVSSGVPQGSVLGPLLFLIFINDIDTSLGSRICKFADDTKLYRVVDSVSDSVLLQSDLDKLVSWSEIWQMSFNVDKCKVVHFGSSNLGFNYCMNSTNLSCSDEERDLGVVVTNNLKPSKQCALSAARANRILGLIRRNFCNLGRDVVLNLYKQLVRPHLEYAIQAWCPFYEKDKFILEQVQRRATRLIPELRKL